MTTKEIPTMIRMWILSLTIALSFIGCTKKSGELENTIQYPLRINLSSLDPAQNANEATNEVIPNIFECLLQYHYLKRPLQVEPLLAAGMPEISKDGLVYKFKIKQGVHFQDSEVFPDGKGRELTAEDFIYSWRRLADPKWKSEQFWLFDGKIKGLNEWRDKLIKGEATYDTAVEGLQAPDKYTLVISLKKPFFQLNYILAMGATAAVPREAVEKWGPEVMNHPVGTGPFMFASWVRGNKVTLKRNPTWHGGTFPSEGEPGDQEKGLLADAGKPLPFIDHLIFYEVPEDQPRWLNFMKGNYDFVWIPKDNFNAATVNSKELKPELVRKGMRLIIYPWTDVVYQGFNMADPILGKNVNLRQALCYAYDQKTANEKFYNNHVITAQSPIAPDMEGYDPNFRNPCKEYSVEKAKELMKKAGYPDGKGLPPLHYDFNASTTGRQMAEYAAQQYEKIGVKMELVSHSWPQFQERLRTKKAQIFGIAWGADYPDAENMLQLLYGPNEAPGSNSANFKNAEYDKLYEEASRLPPGAARTVIYQKMRDIFVREAPWVPTVHRLGYMVVNGWVQNIKPNETIEGFYKYLRVNADKKKELKPKL
jgi:oligopeptide transport system substrate-binding protein